MRPTAAWAAKRHARNHPLLSVSDLLQDALEELSRVWRRLYGQTTEADLVRIGRKAILRRMWRAWRHSGREVQYREAKRLVSLGQAVADEDVSAPADRIKTLYELVEDPAGTEDACAPFALDQLRRCLGAQATQVLDALLQPSGALVKAATWYRRRATARGNWWGQHRARILARGTGLPVEAIPAAMRELRAAALRVFGQGQIERSAYRVVERSHGATGRSSLNDEGCSNMKTSKGFVPEDLDLDAVGSATPAAAGAGAASVGKSAAPVNKERAPKAAKAKTAAPKPKKEKKVAVPKAAAKGGNGKAKASGGRGEGIVAFMLEELTARPTTVMGLAEKTHKKFPAHPVAKLYNTVRGALKIVKARNLKMIHDREKHTYHVIAK
jgi:hypothetical protein